ncbi:PAS domain S-box-containing protein/diguanylate cyclase (GGDEF) domain-containing protein [[Bacillus] enclensis]|uniref:PAS domain S-box-containing protein/diguanylate cyclase (GGDEF) domain-containing protein n=1 Tax=[Bacillus] enclensis TaxID=1402860 RepID=A0A1C4B7R7_9BACI|nr:bifunctional diguanylate cyclase/phosphodiesterase [[Bacillus] enclensis]SCC02876.1 PAS domain S-box-containing protein/diguanylate cyclase (GGDEF) domain-containing protein [[Bacillus] enclensis]
MQALNRKQDNDRLDVVLKDVVLEYINDMIFIMKVEEGPSFRYVYINESARKSTDIKNEDMGRLLDEVLTGGLGSHIKEKYVQLVENEETIIFRDTVELPGGEQMINESILTPIKNELGKIEYVVCITRDVTPIMREKKRLSNARNRYKSIIEHNLDAIFILDSNGVIKESNIAGCQLTGYQKSQMVNSAIYDLFHSSVKKELEEALKKASNGIPSTLEHCMLNTVTGKDKITSIKAVPIVVEEKFDGCYIIIKDNTVSFEQNEMIHYMALHDQLTGLWNRKALDEHLPLFVQSMEDSGRELSVLYLDLDRFKFVNDTLGLTGGDRVLNKITKRLTTLTNDNCLLYRQGGDEFIYLLKNSSLEETKEKATEVLTLFQQSFLMEGQEFYISPSIGISRYPADGFDGNTLIQKAAQALFQVKEKGRAHYRFYQTYMESSFPNYMIMESHLRKAIEKEELSIHYQPQINLSSGTVDSFEALIRWNNRKFGFVSPGQFIPLAEETGLIHGIGEWVLEHVCLQLRNWRERGNKDVRIAINISPKQFQQEQLVDTIREYLEKYGIPAECLEIEITEGAMQDTQQTLSVLKKLKELGVFISVDDFGTGYSSLNYLKRFPIDILKIDQSFVREIGSSQKDSAITTTIIHLAHSLGMEVIAEGVEEEGQVHFLKEANCQKAQGFYFSKPKVPEELEHYVYA